VFGLLVVLFGEWWFVARSLVGVSCVELPVGLPVVGLVVVWIVRTILLVVVDLAEQYVVMAVEDCC